LNPAIIRNRMKIKAAVRNAQAFLAIQEELGGFDAYCWRFVDGRPKINRWKAMREIPATSSESDAFSKDLKRRGFSFVGSTVIYAHMQAVGMVNDHLVDCFRYREIQRLSSVLERAEVPAPPSNRTAPESRPAVGCLNSVCCPVRGSSSAPALRKSPPVRGMR
jgi:Methyladenine glycosylase